MSVICISRGSYYRGREVAHRVAELLNYGCISRDTILEKSDKFAIPEIKLIRNIKHATQILERFSFGRERYINFISAAILSHLKLDNYVYHGIAGHYFMSQINHLLKVRVIADLEERAEEEARRSNISLDQARLQLAHDDEERRLWSLFLYGIDIVEPSMYDLVVNVSAMSVEDAANLIAQAAKLHCYQATEESQAKINDLALAADIRNALFDFPQVRVSTTNGRAFIDAKAPEEQTEAIKQRVMEALNAVNDLQQVEVRINPYY
jgi:cytidylate kinase